MTTGINNPLPAALTFVQSQTLAVDATEIDFTGLGGDYIYTLFGDIDGIDGAIASPEISLYFNADTTATNYHSAKSWNGSGTSTSNTSQIGDLNSTGIMAIQIHCFLNRNSHACAFTQHNEKDGATMSIGNTYVIKDNATVTEITAIKLKIATAVAFKAGSTVSLYKSQRV